MTPNPSRRSSVAPEPMSGRRAFVLIVVLLIVTLLSLTGYKYADLMMAEYKAADKVVRSVQAKALAESGVNYAAALLSDPKGLQDILNNNPFDNPEAFQDKLVLESDTPRFRGKFTIVATPVPGNFGDEDADIRFGVSDEAAKINLNAMMRLDRSGDTLYDMLLRLPNMDETIAACIVDWLDEDGEPRPGGAEDETYTAFEPAYLTKNAPIDSLDELLLVAPIRDNPSILYGGDLNRNGKIDPNESFDGDERMALGLSAYLTVYSREQNVSSDMLPRINLNEKDLNALNQKLSGIVSPDVAKYIMMFRVYGGQRISADTFQKALTSNISSVSEVSDADLNLNSRGKGRVTSILDLVYSSVTVSKGGGKGKSRGNSSSKTYFSPLSDPGVMEQFLPVLYDKTTTTKKTEIPSRININTAPEAVLYTLPELTEDEVQSILAFRPQPGDALNANILAPSLTWLVSDAGIDPNTLRKLERYVTAKSQIYRVQVLGYFEAGGPTVRLEAIIDTNVGNFAGVNQGRPRIVLMRDLTGLGKGFDVSQFVQSE